ncbi:MAG TPA: hypothetical protein VGB85_07235, partial [Nannocystis sp.]
MILQPGPGTTSALVSPGGRAEFPVDPGEVGQVLPLLSPAGVALLSYDEVLLRVRVEARGATIVEQVRGYLPSIAGGELFALTPVAPSAACTYLQSRRLVRYDFDAHDHRVDMVAHGEEMAVAAAWLSPREDAVVVQIEDTSRYDEGGLTLSRLVGFDLTGARARRIGAIQLPRLIARGRGWSAGGGLLGVIVEGELQVLDAGLQRRDDHPLAQAARALTAEAPGVLQELRIHPHAPLALLSVQERDLLGLRDHALWWVRWSGDTVERRLACRLRAIGGLALGAFA